MLCDTHAITEVLVRFGRAHHPAVAQALKQMAADRADTAQGPAWPCVPASGFRGPGRKGDFCPQVTLEALRTLARLPEHQGSELAFEAARTALRAWTARSDEKPYLFGHGAQFKTVKCPTFWYNVHWLLDTVSRYPRLWQGTDADPADRRAVAELVACLVAYNFDPDGTVTPRSCYQGFADHSFGQKKRPSDLATARLAVLLRRLDDLATMPASSMSHVSRAPKEAPASPCSPSTTGAERAGRVTGLPPLPGPQRKGEGLTSTREPVLAERGRRC